MRTLDRGNKAIRGRWSMLRLASILLLAAVALATVSIAVGAMAAPPP
jgi:hypothetical protein